MAEGLSLGYGPRPKGISILMVLSAIMAVVYLADTAATFFGLSLAKDPTFIANLRNSGASQWVIDNISAILTVETAILFAFVVIYFLLYIGFQHGRRWGWSLGIAFSFAGIFFTVFDLLAFPGVSAMWQFVLEILIPVVMLFYLLRPSVKHYFRGAPGETETPEV